MLTRQQLRDLSQKTSLSKQELQEYIYSCKTPITTEDDRWILDALESIASLTEGSSFHVSEVLINEIINHNLADDSIVISNIFANPSISRQLNKDHLLQIAQFSNIAFEGLIKIVQHPKVDKEVLEAVSRNRNNSLESDLVVLDAAQKLGIDEDELIGIVNRAKKVAILFKVFKCNHSVTEAVINSIRSTRFYTSYQDVLDFGIAELKNRAAAEQRLQDVLASEQRKQEELRRQHQIEAEAQRLSDIAAKEEALRCQRQAEEENQRLRQDSAAREREETLRRRKAEEEERARQNKEAQRAAAREEESRRQRQEAQRAAAEREEALRRQRQALDAELRAANEARRAAENARAQYGNRGVMFGQGRNVVNNIDQLSSVELKQLAVCDPIARAKCRNLGS